MVGRAVAGVEKVPGMALYVGRRFLDDDALRVAAALAYTSLLALVPLLAIGLAMLAAFPVFDDVRARLQGLIFENFAPDVGAAVQDYVTEFVARAGELTAAGIVGLGVTAVLLLVTIETSLNEIFRVARPRPMPSRLFMYWTLVTLGPLLLGASLSLSGYLAVVEGLAPGLWQQVLPTLLVVLAFALFYFAVPNRRVRLLDALMGGLFAGLLFTGLRYGFGVYVANVRVYQSVYGALAAVPLFLVWMFLSWAVVLLGAELTASLPEWRSGRRRPRLSLTPRRRLALAVDVIGAAYRASVEGRLGVEREALLHATGADEPTTTEMVRTLLKAGLLARTQDGDQVLLARDLETVTLYELLRTLGLALGETVTEAPPQPWRAREQDLTDRLDACEHEILDISVKSLLTGGREG